MRKRLLLPTLLAGILVLGVTASAQAVPAGWDVIVSVRKDQIGADLVSVGPRVADYPPALLRSQLAALGGRLGGEARGISVNAESYRPGDPSATILRGTCAVDGLIDAAGGLAIAPIAQAFAGAPEPYTVHRMLVSFDGVTVRPGRTVAYHTAGPESDLAFSGRLVGSSIEYAVELRSQNRRRLVVHEAGTTARVVAPRRAPIDATAIGLVVAAVLAAGALVYCGLLLVGHRPVAKS